MPTAEKKDFNAWHDKMPGSHQKLIVVGKITVSTTGWKAELVEAKPQGIVPEILILNVHATKPTGAAGDLVSHLSLRFEKEGGDQYAEVTIRGAGPDFTIPVGDAE